MSGIRDYVNLLPSVATMVRRLRADDRVPRKAKIALAAGLASIVSPIDLIPDFIPVIGALDYIAIAVMVLRYVRRQIPRDAFEDVWPGDREMLDRLLRWTS